MNSGVRIEELYSCNVKYISPLFERFEYPWELIMQIKDYIYELFDNKPEGYSFIKHDVLVGKNVKIHSAATIEGPVIIGSGSEIRPNAFIRGSVITGEGCVIGNSSELKNCILLDCVQVPHYNYVGDSVLGSRAHMGAGSICSNLKSDGKNVVVHGEIDFDTGMRKVGAFLGDEADVGCGCVLNPGTVIGKNSSVYPLTVTRGVYPANAIIKSTKIVVPRQERTIRTRFKDTNFT